MEVNVQPPAPTASARRLFIGGNVALAVVLAVALVGVVQAFSYRALSTARYDMTRSGVNSLSDGTKNLLRGLDKNIRITSLYFETDREEADQPRYRRAVQNLLGLYEASNRARITTDYINPLKDRDRFNALTARLRGLSAYKADIERQTARVDEYKNQLDVAMRKLLQEESSAIRDLTTGLGGGDPAVMKILAPVENLFAQLLSEAESIRQQVDTFTLPDNPQFTAATGEISGLLRKVSKACKDVIAYADKAAAQNDSLPQDVMHYLRGASARYADLVAAVEAEITQLQDLEPPKVEEVLSQLGPTTNPIVVETDGEARVVDFSSVWPPLDQGSRGQTRFEQRAFKGEEKLTAAILRVTHKEQTAVVFVRYGGSPLFMGGFMPGQPPAPYAAMKQQLEDANFIVQEWDLKTAETMPTIDPTPTRTIFVVLKPTPPERGPFGQPGQDPPFGENHRQALLTALGDNPRVLFIAGWTPGPFGPIPSSYEFNDYLKTNWGVEVDTSALLIETAEFEPGKFTVARRDFYNMRDLRGAGHPILSGADAGTLGLPWAAPLVLSDPPPDGVRHETLVTLPARDGIWGVRNIQAYQDQLNERQYMTRVAGDLTGPFTLGVVATRGDAKIVVVSARAFAEDATAFARVMVLGPSGFDVRFSNPGNVTLMVNALHYLSDNLQFLNIGKPIESAVLTVNDPKQVTWVRATAIFLWPLLALACGGVAWYVRRR